MDMTQALTIIAVFAANIGTTITLFVWATNRSDEHRKETTAIIRSIQEEIKDFHGRLCAIEERNRGK